MNDPIRILNLGAGVQSTVLALMVHRGILPPIRAAIFADVQEEPKAVYDHLQWLIAEVSPSFPVMVRTAGKLGDAITTGRLHRKGHSNIPAFTLNHSTGAVAIMPRRCTSDYKVDVVEKAIREELLMLKRRQRWPRELVVHQLFGLSLEECGRAGRVAKAFENGPRKGRSVPIFPLIQMEMTRRSCLKWLRDYGVPHEVERSACVFCPYKSNSEWQRLKKRPEEFGRAVKIDRMLRSDNLANRNGMRNLQFLHRSCVPLDEIDFRTAEERGDQGTLGFMAECEGMCGV
jgi:hypothetical protein